jgi:hypothetical protein
MQTFYTLKRFSLIAALFIYTTVVAQDEIIKPARNYAGLNAVIDAANTSVTFGLEYERLLIMKGRFTAGIRANWYKPYTSGNADISIGSPYNSGYANDYRISLLQTMATASVFTSQYKEDRGFFISLAAGIVYSHAKKKQASSVGNASYINWLPTIETGLGFVTSLSGNNTMKWSAALSFAGEQQTPRPYTESRLVLLSLKAAVGF